MTYFYILIGFLLVEFIAACFLLFGSGTIFQLTLQKICSLSFKGVLLYTLYQFMNGVEGGFESMATVINLIIQHIQSKGI